MRRLAVALVLAAAGTAHARPKGGVIDPRGDGAPANARAAARESLAQHADLIQDPALTAALVGASDPGPLAAAKGELRAASEAYGKLDCVAAGAHAETAARSYLTLADPGEVRAELERALSITLLCADSAGDRGAAQAAARRLRALGSQSPPGVPAAVWSRYPEVDAASNVILGPVRVETDPPGAQVWIDLAPAGTAPIEQALLPGGHWIVASAPGRARSMTEVQVKEGRSQTVHLALAAAPAEPWGTLRQRVAGWREGAAPGGADLAGVMREAGIDVAVVLEGEHASVWLLRSGAAAAERVESVEEAVRVLESRPLATPPVEKKKGRPKWIYGAVIGSVLLAAGFVYLMDAGEDVQRIEVSWP